jgi:hypothetical protein
MHYVYIQSHTRSARRARGSLCSLGIYYILFLLLLMSCVDVLMQPKHTLTENAYRSLSLTCAPAMEAALYDCSAGSMKRNLVQIDKLLEAWFSSPNLS